MEAGVVVVGPAEQPDVEVLVAQQLLVGAVGRVVLDVVGPERRPGRDLVRDGEQLLVGQVLAVRPGDVGRFPWSCEVSFLAVGQQGMRVRTSQEPPQLRGRARARRGRRRAGRSRRRAARRRPRRPSPRACAARRKRCRRRPRDRAREAPCRRERRSAPAAAAPRRPASRTAPAGGDARAGRRAGRRTTRPASGRRSRSARATRRAAAASGRPRRKARPGRDGRTAARRGIRAGRAAGRRARARRGWRGRSPAARCRRIPCRSRRRLQPGRVPPAAPRPSRRSSPAGPRCPGDGPPAAAGPRRPGASRSRARWRARRAPGRRRRAASPPSAGRRSSRRTRGRCRARRSTRNVQPSPSANQHRRLLPPRQLGDQLLGEKVLMDVDASAFLSKLIKILDLRQIRGPPAPRRLPFKPRG